MAEDPMGVAAQMVEAFNDADWPGFDALLDREVVYEETGTGRRFEGAEAYLGLCRSWKRALPDVRGTVVRQLGTGSTVVQEVTWTGTHAGPLKTPSGTIPPTGRTVTVWGTLWMTARDGRCQSVRHHLDVLSLLGQLGALPTPTGTRA
jgi:steroid delta-isomerase-like uncharacterized protein